MDNLSSYNKLYSFFLSRLHSEAPGVLADYPFSLYEILLSQKSPNLSYRLSSEETAKLCQNLIEEHSVETLDLYHRCLLLYLIVHAAQAQDYKRYTPYIAECFIIEHQRIAHEVTTNPPGFYQYDNDLFCKDLAVCTHEMFPIGAFKTEVSGIPRRVLFCGGWRQFARTVLIAVKLRKHFPTYEIHFDIRLRENFSPQGWDHCFLQLSEMLEKNPEFLGFTGASWFFDPEIKRVSPHLGYLRQRIEDGGGEFFFYKITNTTTELALASSITRRKLYERGLYKPSSYLAFWPKTKLMEWALTHNKDR